MKLNNTSANTATLFMLMAGLSHAAYAQQGRPAGSGWKSSITAAYAWQGDTDIDSSGKFSVDRGVVEFRSSGRTGRRMFTGVSIGYEQDNYTFSSMAAAPWSDIRKLQLGVSMRYLASQKWMLFGLPFLRYSAESGVDLTEGREYGLLAGASYRFSDKLTLGPGFGAIRGIGDEQDYFPILLIDWKITDSVSLETGRGIAASRGPGLALKWQPVDQWVLGLAARYEKSRFRLATADRIGEDKSVPLVLTANWRMNRMISVTAFAGAETSGALSIENSSGNRVERHSYDTAPVAGLSVALKF